MKNYLMLLAVSIVMLSANIANSQNSRGITITEPINDQEVSQHERVISFQTDVGVEKDEIPVVFIKDPTRQWWPWLHAKSVSDERNEWELENVQFGVDNDSGQEFQIQVLLFSDSDIDKGFQIEVQGETIKIFIQGGTSIKNNVFTVLIERQRIRSDSITVTRE